MTNTELAYRSFCTERFPLPTDEQVGKFEDHLGVTLPGHFREYLLECNGGFFDDPEFGGNAPDYELCPRDALNTLFAIQTEHKFAMVGKKSHILLFDDNDPVVILPIGNTPMNNLLLLSVDVSADEYGTIYLKRIDNSVLMLGEWFELADTMEEFFALLRASDA